MPFQPGNQEHKKADMRRARVITQKLVATLNDIDTDNLSKMQRLINALIAKALDGDVSAIKEIMDRVDGKVPQTIQGDPDAPLIIDRIVREFVEPVEPKMLQISHTNGDAGDH